jgi:DNA-binding XRE family transcriptional regulator
MDPRRTRERISMIEEERKSDRRRQEVQVIKRIGRPDEMGRGVYLPGLWACRLAAGITQRELAQMSGTARTTIRSLERGDRHAHATTLRRLSEALEVSPADLLTAQVAEEE